MKRSLIFAVVIILLGGIALAKPRPVDTEDLPRPVEHVGIPAMAPGPQAKAADTTYVYGGPDTYEGRFETAGGQPDWQGWTHQDMVTAPPNHWHISTYWAEDLGGNGPGNHAMNCTDETIPACALPDTIGGYGNGWFDDLEWVHTVADTTQPVTLRLTGFMNYDLTDATWDFLEFFVQRGDDTDMLAQWTGTGSPVDTLDILTVISPGEFSGPDRNQIRIFWRVWSDGGYSDEDCLTPGPGHGAARIDDVAVYLDDNLTTFDDFEPGSPVHWAPIEFIGVGDFTSLRNNLGDRDPCSSNNSWQVNFIDDGVVVPGTGGTPCISHCYDPGGWIVNNDGGLLADNDRDWFLHNRIISPPIAWPAGYDGAELAFDVYRHELFSENPPGMFYTWQVRSTANPNPVDIEQASWTSRRFAYEGGPDYHRMIEYVGDLLVENRKWVQVSLDINELGWIWGRTSNDGTPAPYFDNVALKAWDPQGPLIDVHLADSFMDAFPSSGVLDPTDLSANSCFVDRPGSAISGRLDSLTVDLVSLRHGATRNVPPAMHWVMECSDLFDPVRAESPDGSGILRGSTEGLPASYGGTVYEDKWAFDLPDTGFFFPGDRLRWYITASDDISGDVRTSVWPPDTTGITDFSPGSSWTKLAEARGLPSVTTPTGGSFPHPSMLLIDKSSWPSYNGAQVGDMSPWLDGLAELGLHPGHDFDLARISSDLSGQLEVADLAYYETILFVSGANFNHWRDGWNDDVFDELLFLGWLDLGGRRALFSGEQVTRSISPSTPLADRLGIHNEDRDITTLNGGARELQVTPVAWKGVLPGDQAWSLSNGCPDARFTEAITVVPGVGQMAASLDPVGTPGGSYGGLVAVEDGLDNRTLVMPFDLSRVEGTVGGEKNVLTPQAEFLDHLLTWLETGGVSAIDDVPGVRDVTVAAHPNPFNPSTTIAFELPRAAVVSLDIYDLQGRLVRRLLDESSFVSGSHKQVWDGRDSQGRATSSGVYFYRFAAGDHKRVGKLTLLK